MGIGAELERLTVERTERDLRVDLDEPMLARTDACNLEDPMAQRITLGRDTVAVAFAGERQGLLVVLEGLYTQPANALIGIERVEEFSVSNSAAVSSDNCRYIKVM